MKEKETEHNTYIGGQGSSSAPTTDNNIIWMENSRLNITQKENVLLRSMYTKQ